MTIAEQLATILFEDKYKQQAEQQVQQQVQQQVKQQVKQAEQQAIKDNTVQTAIKALEKGAEVSFVADITGLSIEQVQAIKAENNL